MELESHVFFQLFFLNLGAFGRCTGITFVDSTMIPVCHNLRRYANKVFKEITTDGKGTMGWCHGFKLYLACNDRDEIIAFVLTGANVCDKDPNVTRFLLNVCMASCSLTKAIFHRSCLTSSLRMEYSW